MWVVTCGTPVFAWKSLTHVTQVPVPVMQTFTGFMCPIQGGAGFAADAV
jgi:hypothetical protein